jgi:amino acid adenylation domain-containing protein
MTNASGPNRQKHLQQTSDTTLHYQQNSFQELLQHVWKRSSFYRDFYESYGIKEKDLPDLTVSDLPILSKKMLMENFDRAVADPRLKKKELEQWIQEVPDPAQIYGDHFIVLHTSGSTGDIAIFVYDFNAWRFMNWTVTKNLPPPENIVDGKTRVACYLAVHGHFAGVTTASLLSRTVYDVLVASLLDATEHVVKQLNEFQPHRISGYPSSVAMLADLALRSKLHIHPHTLLVGGEVLTESMKQKIQSAWGSATIYEMYSASESIYIAIRRAGEASMMVVNDLNILEVLGQDHRTVSPGESGQVVITNLFNYVLPILRYDLGDYAVRGQGRLDAPITTIQSIQGRVNDALPVMLDNGKLDIIHPIILSEFYVAGLENVQFISRRLDYVEVLYVARENIDESARREFHRILALKGAVRTTFDVRRVDQIDLDPRTGKLPLVKIDVELQGVSERTARLSLAQIAVEESLPETPSELAVNTGSVNLESYDMQQDVIAKCFHPLGGFVEFKREDIEQSIPDRFEQMVRKYSDRIAVKSANGSVTYKELNVAANRIAHTILQAQPKGSEPVTLLFQDGAAAIAASLGVLKSGKVFVPLNPSLPQARITAVLKDLEARLIVTDSTYYSFAREVCLDGMDLINVDALGSSVSDNNVDLFISPDTGAYILYTSGSTGQPKGVIHNHRNVIHFAMEYTNALHICANDRLSLLYSNSVMGGAQDMFSALLNGASLYPFDVKQEGFARLASWLTQQEITIYHSVPTVFRSLVDVLNVGTQEFPSLRLIKLIGEPVSNKDVALFKKHFWPGCIFVNVLSSTETGAVRWYFVDHGTTLIGTTLPVGYSVEDKEVVLLDDTGNDVGVNQIGEIAVKSRYVSLGYWRRSDLTERVFTGDPKSKDRRVFRTGNVGRILRDGCLEHLGRKDFQVKIRGHRIEVEEIEVRLLEHPSVREAAVTASDGPSGQYLAAYWVASGVASPVHELRSFLQERLPDYMVPSFFVRLDALPLLANGKINRQALPPADLARSEEDSAFVPPGNPTEETIAEIWAELLKLDKVGIHDNFFDLGGHSLVATQIISKVLETLKVELPVRSFFEVPTVAGLAKFIETMRSSGENVEDRLESEKEREVGSL